MPWRLIDPASESGLAEARGLGVRAEDRARIEASARSAEGVCRLVRIGRGRPVERQASIDAGAVSESILEKVVHLATSVGADAGHLTPAVPLPRGEVRAGVVEALAADRRSGRLRREALDRLFMAARI